MNIELSEALGEYFARIPLKKSANIIHGNALEIDWKSVVAPTELSYILGNPPFIGARMKSSEQSKEMELICKGLKGWGDLDYVTAWYLKSAEYIQNTNIQCAFVSTNSIVQGTQAGALWAEMFNKYGIKINFGHKTFMWDSEASGKAHVYCVIVGFACFDTAKKRLFEYDDVKGEPHEVMATNINQYLVDAKSVIIQSRSKPLCNVIEMGIGNKPIDGGNYLFTEEEKEDFIGKEPFSKEFFKPWVGAEEFINNKKRYCLWLGDISPDKLAKMPLAKERVENVKNLRLASTSEGTRKLAQYPRNFHIENMPENDYILVPSTSSERRKYIPIGFVDKDIIASNATLIIPNASLYEFGVLTSVMHMTWTKYVCGRLESRYRYSNKIVYNNYPWPLNPTTKQVENVKQKAQAVLDVRAKYQDCSLAILYNPETMPTDLTKAHNELNKTVDACYGKKSFTTEMERMEFLFNLYEQYSSPLVKGKK